MITQKDKELLTDWLCTNVKVEPSVIGLIVKHVDNYFQSIPAKEELEARDSERDRRVAAEAWDDGSSSAYGNTKPEGPCRFDSTQHLKDKETYLNSLINK